MVPWMIVAGDLCFKQNVWTVMWELDHEDNAMSPDTTEDASELQGEVMRFGEGAKIETVASSRYLNLLHPLLKFLPALQLCVHCYEFAISFCSIKQLDACLYKTQQRQVNKWILKLM